MPGLFEGFFARHRRGATLATLVLVSLICLMISNRTLVVRPKEVGLSVAGFFQKGVTGLFKWFGDTAGSIGQLQAARDELAAARSRLEQMDQANREVVELRRQNGALKEQLDFAQTLPPERIGAEVIARDTDNLFSTLTINKGSRQGVKKGMPVVAWQGDIEGLVGKVVLVGPGSSQVLPLYDPQCIVSARVDTTRDEGLVSGQGRDRGLTVMNYVKKIAKDKIGYGDLVVTSGLGGVYPKGINIGRIREISAPAYETSLVLQVQPIIDFDRLEYLFMIDPEGDAAAANAAAGSTGTLPGPAAGTPGGTSTGPATGMRPGTAGGAAAAVRPAPGTGAAAAGTGSSP
jgi:rod shape-determining protein MreC